MPLGIRPLARAAILASALTIALVSTACAPEIGRGCSVSTDCSVNNDRACDTAQPGGYCTILGCDPDSCPDGAICVEWRFEPSRTAATYCMKRCGSCRDQYECIGEDDPRLIEDGQPIARITDLSNSRRDARFCAAVRDIDPAASGLSSLGPDAGFR